MIRNCQWWGKITYSPLSQKDTVLDKIGTFQALKVNFGEILEVTLHFFV